jgi:hypothetical protein
MAQCAISPRLVSGLVAMAGKAYHAVLGQREYDRIVMATRAAAAEMGSCGMDVEWSRRMAGSAVPFHAMVLVVAVATVTRDRVSDRRDMARRALV